MSGRSFPATQRNAGLDIITNNITDPLPTLFFYPLMRHRLGPLDPVTFN